VNFSDIKKFTKISTSITSLSTMDYLVSAFNRIYSIFKGNRNLEYVGTYHYHPASPATHDAHIEAHKKTLHHAFNKYLYSEEINRIINLHRRSDITLDAILDDFFANDVEQHDIPFDEHVEYDSKQC